MIQLRLTRYLFTEIVPQFLIWLCVLSGVLVVSQLVRLTDVLSNFGLSLENILLPFLFMILPFLAYTIPMAFLFAVIVGMSRLSIDGEYTAILANGYSLYRLVMPLLVLAIFLFGVSGFASMILEPWGRVELYKFYERKAQTELDNLMRFKLQGGLFLDDFLGFVLYAQEVSKDRQHLSGVLMAPGERNNNMGSFTLTAPRAVVSGTVEGGDLKMAFHDGSLVTHDAGGSSTVLDFDFAEVDILSVFQDQIFTGQNLQDDFRNYFPDRLWRYAQELKADYSGPSQQYLYQKVAVVFHQRLANPFCVVFFALFGLILGIQDPRHLKGGVWLGGISILVSAYVSTMLFKWLAESGQLEPVVAAWLPNVIFLTLGIFLIHQKNRLPISESVWAWRNMPFVLRTSTAR